METGKIIVPEFVHIVVISVVLLIIFYSCIHKLNFSSLKQVDFSTVPPFSPAIIRDYLPWSSTVKGF